MSTRNDDLEFAQRAEQLFLQMERNQVSVDSDGILPPGVQSVLRLLSELDKNNSNRAVNQGHGGARIPTDIAIGRFQLTYLLGEGAHGVVYLADDTLLDRVVALKLPKPHVLFTSKLRERFLREARAASKIHHPHIVHTYDASADNELTFIASEYCSGGSLADWLETANARISPMESARIIADLADAIEHAHQHNTLHRDIKPSNILLAPVGDVDSAEFPFSVKLADFGLAKAILDRDEQTRTGEIIGTVRYMSPEQIRDPKSVCAATDVYGLGVVMYRLLTGRLPFEGETEADTIRRITEEAPPDVNASADVPKDLVAICMKCIEKQPLDRYRSAGALSADIRRFLNGEPTIARPLGPIGRLIRWGKRNPTYAALWGAVAVLLIVGLAGLAYHNWRLGNMLDELALEKLHSDASRKIAEGSAAVAESRKVLLERRQRDLTTAYYAADMNLAFQALHSQLPSLVSETLQRHEYDEGNFDPRGFEWQYLHRMISPNSEVLLSGSAESHICLSDDSSSLFVTDGSNFVRQVDIASKSIRTELRLQRGAREIAVCRSTGRIAVAHGGPLKSTVAVYGDDGQWQMDLDTQDATIESLAFSNDGELLAAGARYASVNVWNAEGTLVHQFPSESRNEATAFSQDGRHLAYSVFEQHPERDYIRIVCTKDWTTTAELPIERKDEQLCFSPDSNLFAYSSQFDVCVCSTDDFLNPVVLNAGRTRTSKIEFSTDGLLLFAVSKAGVLRYWEFEGQPKFTGKATANLKVDTKGSSGIHGGRVNSLVALGEDHVVTSGTDGQIRQTQIARIERLVQSDTPDSIAYMTRNRDGLIAFAFYDGRDGILHSDGSTKVIQQFERDKDTAWLRRICISPNSKAIASTSGNRLVVASLDGHHIFKQQFSGGKLIDVDFVSDELLVVVQEDADKATLVDLSDNHANLVEMPGPIVAAAVLGSRQQIAFALDMEGSAQSLIVLYDVAKRVELGRVYLAGETFSLTSSNDGWRLASGNNDGTVEIFSAHRLSKTSAIDTQKSQRVGAVSFSNDGKTVLTGNADGSVELWQVESGRNIGTLLEGTGSPVQSIAIDADDRIVCGLGKSTATLIRYGPGSR
ncbi:MAG: protein kinase [Planctomycetales bacterium]|nr:protein kinase [Planctomycetales bacterium]